MAKKTTEKADIVLAFDLDGTIFDVSPIAVRAFDRGIDSFIKDRNATGVARPGHEEIINLLGTPINEIFSTLFPGLSSRDQALLNDHCTDAFVHLIDRGGGRLLDGVDSTLALLGSRGHTMVIASNGRAEYVDAVLRRHDIGDHFRRPFVFLGETVADKAAIVGAYRASMAESGVLIMIGDRRSDREAAEKNGVPFIGCAFGHGNREEIQGTRWVATAFNELPEIIGSIERELDR
jgi:phosphoglycolate phosphatase